MLEYSIQLMGFLTANRPRRTKRDREEVRQYRFKKKQFLRPDNDPAAVSVDITEDQLTQFSLHTNAQRGLEYLPVEILQDIFIMSGNFSMVECSRRLYFALIGDSTLVVRFARSLVKATNTGNSFLADVCGRRFVTVELLQNLKAEAFHSLIEPGTRAAFPSTLVQEPFNNRKLRLNGIHERKNVLLSKRRRYLLCGVVQTLIIVLLKRVVGHRSLS